MLTAFTAGVTLAAPAHAAGVGLWDAVFLAVFPQARLRQPFEHRPDTRKYPGCQADRFEEPAVVPGDGGLQAGAVQVGHDRAGHGVRVDQHYVLE